ncbi:glycerophosphodiester phosphodiesterase [Shouchella rhizosphaerae]|uniref:glycerophosphodiester phosphodiesterase n=2 Tax=Shouchella rhizosphaerae TaxID=866786 RepID=UPI0020401543|nr:glycerophosphodiester phosphodiesterase family protein [Shouchella rhizosphaerae]MCM3378885.1 glycerophosphodiester phosphodiesterase [Shouchella rhizosphaerae]
MIKAIAHRGYSRKYPENTLSAFEAAIRLGFYWIEMDVRLTKDGVPLIIHDPKVDRVTNGKGCVKDYSLAALKELTVYEKERLPTLKEVFAAFAGRCKMAIELKKDKNGDNGIEHAVYQLIKDYNLEQDVYINSFNHASIERMRELSPALELGLIQTKPTKALLPYMKTIHASSLAIHIRHFSRKFAEQCSREGVQLIVYNVDSVRLIKKMSNFPNVRCTVNELERFKKWYKPAGS